MFVSKDFHVYSMDKASPVAAKVDLPALLTFETLDCFAGQLCSEKDTLENLDFDHVNPATGPVYFNGIKAGDVIKVHIRDIRFGPQGIMVAAPEAGVLGGLIKESQTIMVPIENGIARVLNIDLPLKPMIGVIGVAPSGEAIACGTPGAHGGNMDNTLITVDSTLYLPVQVDGALLAMGDMHATMGDGEINVSGVEAPGEVDVTVEKAEGIKLNNPLIVTRNVVAAIASAPTLDDAVEQATIDMANLLQEYTGLTLNEAGMLMSACGNAEVCQVVDPLRTARFAMPAWVMRRLGFGIAF